MTVSGPSPARVVSEVLCSQLLSEVRCAIRGRTVADLASAASIPELVVQEACELLTARGQLVHRGMKYFVA
jgi:hypothetical protein